MATKIVTKNSSTASAVPTASDLVQGELAVNVADKRLFTEDNGGSIVELGTNPSTIDINAGSIDGTAIGASSASTGAFTTLTASGAFTSVGIDDNATSTAITIDSSENVGIGTSSPSALLHLKSADPILKFEDSAGGDTFGIFASASDFLGFYNFTDSRTDVVIDGSGNLLVGTTTVSLYNSNSEVGSRVGDGVLMVNRSGLTPAYFNRLSNDGTIVDFRKDGSTVGSIGTVASALTAGSGDTGLLFQPAFDRILPFNMSTNAGRDNAIDLGESGTRFDDIYATNGTIQTSDRNEKQDIAELSEAEQRVAVACKGLLRKFRWKDSVAEKGDDARIHFGIIAQDLQDAFEAEGLDAGDYAMFISTTWWEQDVEVPAVEAVDAVYETQTDEEGNETQVLVQEAVEAVDAYTKTDTFETAEEAPEGATEKTRLGVRYSELLAFIISAL